MMHVITYKGKPVTLAKLNDIEPLSASSYHRARDESYLAAPSKQKAIALYLFHFGYTWRERTKGVECQKVKTV